MSKINTDFDIIELIYNSELAISWKYRGNRYDSAFDNNASSTTTIEVRGLVIKLQNIKRVLLLWYLWVLFSQKRCLYISNFLLFLQFRTLLCNKPYVHIDYEDTWLSFLRTYSICLFRSLCRVALYSHWIKGYLTFSRTSMFSLVINSNINVSVSVWLLV